MYGTILMRNEEGVTASQQQQQPNGNLLKSVARRRESQPRDFFSWAHTFPDGLVLQGGSVGLPSRDISSLITIKKSQVLGSKPALKF